MLDFDPINHTYRVDGVVVPSVTQVLKSVGLINFSGIDALTLKRAADFGVAVHYACHLDDIDDLDESTLDDTLKPDLGAWRAFKGPKDDPMFFRQLETPIYSPVYQFAGTPDRISGQVIIDIKTGTTVYPVTALQLAGYAVLADRPTARRLAVQLKPDGKYQIHEYKDRKDREIFLACLAIYNWRIKNETM